MPVVKSASGAIVGKCVGMLVGASEGGVVGEAQELGQSSLTVLVFLKPGGGGSAPQPSAHEALHGAPSCVTATSHGVPPRSEKVPSSFKTVIEHNEAASAVVLSNADAKIDRSPMWTQNANALRCCKGHSPCNETSNERTFSTGPGIPGNSKKFKPDTHMGKKRRLKRRRRPRISTRRRAKNAALHEVAIPLIHSMRRRLQSVPPEFVLRRCGAL